jgi:hypothetical protein
MTDEEQNYSVPRVNTVMMKVAFCEQAGSLNTVIIIVKLTI